MRIVSLLPSATEILFAIGAGDDVVGVSFECNYPPHARQRQIVSTSALPPGLTPGQIDAEVRARAASGEDLYHLDAGALRDLDAELIVTQDLCAVCAVPVATVDDALDHLGCRAEVLTLDPMTLEDVLGTIVTVGRATGHEDDARAVVAALQTRLDAVAEATAGRPPPRLAVLEWTDPLFSAGHWVPDLVAAAGAVSALGASGQHSSRIEPAVVVASAPDAVVVAPCGYDLAATCDLARQLQTTGAIPDGVPVWAIDADAVIVRPGPRLVDGVEALASIAHPDVVGARSDLVARL